MDVALPQLAEPRRSFPLDAETVSGKLPTLEELASRVNNSKSEYSILEKHPYSFTDVLGGTNL
jgi:hypothetical protein